MGKQANGHEDNIILFPGLVTRLVEKGMASLKEKKYYDALRYFQQSTEMEPTHPQARYGLVITNIELNRLDEAKRHCESMLREGIGQYYEVLQVYVSLLVQLGDYEQVEMLLETVISEEKLPPKMAESFYQLLEFSRQMTSPNGKAELEDFTEDNFEGIGNTEEWINLLEQGKPDQQWGAIQKISQMKKEDVLNTCRTFMKGENNNPVLKSYLLQMLKEMNVEDTIEVHKFGKSFNVNIGNLEDVFHEQFGTSVLTKLDAELGQESPSLFEIVQQVWWHYLFALYPKSPTPSDKTVWAAALHSLGFTLMGVEQDLNEVTSRYGVDKEEVIKAVEHMKSIEADLMLIQSERT
ncbi:tetratricopeptide (TPR) repeat protein [Evansella vedderi]|uniref:Tetratricopeptide (TPR) repeat protein n=1 Tax=Evansella vedderi TaxID=38282 RepID=A0ABT9ZZ00_9BACI|nr:tetratricopeptide repeat protein [Evansella vedderi]MDQ0256476.1 tetratricopeptide (TPR) repeat protein [Evansella vedderi]